MARAAWRGTCASARAPAARPQPILGVILFLTGAQLALGSCDFGTSKNDRFVSIVTAALAIYNVGIAFVAGALVCWLLKRGFARL